VSSSMIGPIATALREAITHRADTEERTKGNYHLFALLKKK
jgi:hypothetical protein